MAAEPTRIARLAAAFENWRGTYFPERQLFLRSQGRVRFLTIPSFVQMGMAASLLVALGWGAVTSYAYLTRDLVLDNKNRTISTMSAQYQTLSSDFSALEAEVERRAELLEERQRFLETMLQSEPLTTAPQDATATPIEAAPEAEAAAEPSEQADDDTQSSLLDAFTLSSPAQAAAPSNIDRRKVLLAGLQDMERRQRSLAGVMLEELEGQIAAVDSALAPTTLSADDLLAQHHIGPMAAGGPYVPDRAFEGVFEAGDGDTFRALKDTSERLKIVTLALNSYPVGEPAAEYYISSRFGGRKDPLKHTWAHHPGLDLAAWPGTAIFAAAPGKVIYSGWFGPYGNMVEIDHGNGFRTRYGHMRKLRVNKGEQVDLGHRLGDMGSTGRVTGTHLHYEVWFNDAVIDPLPFMKAAEHVLKIQGRYEETTE